MNEQQYSKYNECLAHCQLNAWLYMFSGDSFYLDKHAEYSKRLDDIMTEINGDWKKLQNSENSCK